ncbi:MAG: hypothetical protein BWX85_00482 [Chloroflexi bacterium ADurb.Bin120]|jgi:hypothetical protein|uniref:DUF2961 domain-containing protein n=1 Tax=Candidatus Brevifilum fermentans TaxID=1986204 RepID=A0A1Y6K5U1_9CHLR|nr:glycoside hydrolase family 172 protein [Brevefilum fermentans]OQB86788.1 MAG: hypothetical protein BWX85_00482 [Chloroflexi bacterium ADurb.Bin120]SMX55051.1 conserved protein of unknown function [Brevefilum fermentans]HOM66615.1 DUF2961 domain-containing protein [Brevefilum fermentans]
MSMFDFGLTLGNLSRLSQAETRSISPENRTGAKGEGGMSTTGLEWERAAADLGQGWKVSPFIALQPGEISTLAEIPSPGCIQHIWCTTPSIHWRSLILRFYWDDEQEPSIEVPLGDFFCCGWTVPCRVNSLPVVVNPNGGFNAYWPMPFHRNARVTLENIGYKKVDSFFYQINYTLTQIPDDHATLHAAWRRANPLPRGEDFTIIDNVKGQGHYVGTYLAWGAIQSGWWGEGEVKVFLDGDKAFPTICGTGTEDYFGGAWCFYEGEGNERKYGRFSTPFLGMPQVLLPDGLKLSQARFGLYRWHIMDPIRFKTDLRITIQDLGWRVVKPMRYLQRSDDIASVAFWYQTEPHAAFAALPGIDYLEVV